MGNWRSIRSSSRARTTERGFALALALIVAVLYFGLLQLMLWDASRELAEARRFRARVIALTYAENGAELAALHLALPQAVVLPTGVQAEDEQGECTGKAYKGAEANTGTPFKLEGTGRATGVTEAKARVTITGVILGGRVKIYDSEHSQ